MYIMSEAATRRIDLLKDAILDLREVKSNPTLKHNINKIFDSYDETARELDRSFKRTYGIDWDLKK